MAIMWTSDLDTGIGEIDAQHKRIVDYINQLETAMRQHDQALVGRVLTELVDYTVSHFAFEEQLMQDVHYGFLKVHKTLHDNFTNQVGKFKAQHQAGDDVAGQLHDMLEKWLVAHIKREDKLYAAEVGANMQQLVQDTQAGGWLTRSLKKFFG